VSDMVTETGINYIDHEDAISQMGPWPIEGTLFPVDEGVPIPDHKGHVVYRDPSGQVSVGVWECAPGSFKFLEEGVAVERCLMGRATIVDEATGRSVEAVPGKQWIVPPGTTEIWTVHETFRKEYVIHDLDTTEDRFW